MPNLIKINARFINDETEEPITGKDFLVKVYDKDIFTDDYMGEGHLDKTGSFELLADIEKASSLETPLEFKPDIYFVLYYQNKKIFKSDIFWDVDFLKTEEKTGLQKNTAQFFGEFRIKLDPKKVNITSRNTEQFCIYGRIIDHRSEPLSDIIITIADRDLIFDDLLAIGHPDKRGYFRFHFLKSEFRQGFFEFEKLPNIYCLFSVFDPSVNSYVILKKEEFKELTFQNGEEYLGNIVIDNYYTKEVHKDLKKIDPFLLIKCRKKRIKLNNETIDMCLQEVISFLNDKTKYDIKQTDIKVEIVKNIKEFEKYLKKISKLISLSRKKENVFTSNIDSTLAKIVSIIFFNYFPSWYDPFDQIIYLNKQIVEFSNFDELKIILGHELIHFYQFKFTGSLIFLHQKYLEEIVNTVLNCENFKGYDDNNLIEKIKNSNFIKLIKLIEGYATYIQKKYLEEYYNCATSFPHKANFFVQILTHYMRKPTNYKNHVTRSVIDFNFSLYPKDYEIASDMSEKDFEKMYIQLFSNKK